MKRSKKGDEKKSGEGDENKRDEEDLDVGGEGNKEIEREEKRNKIKLLVIMKDLVIMKRTMLRYQ